MISFQTLKGHPNAKLGFHLTFTLSLTVYVYVFLNQILNFNREHKKGWYGEDLFYLVNSNVHTFISCIHIIIAMVKTNSYLCFNKHFLVYYSF